MVLFEEWRAETCESSLGRMDIKPSGKEGSIAIRPQTVDLSLRPRTCNSLKPDPARYGEVIGGVQLEDVHTPATPLKPCCPQT